MNELANNKTDYVIASAKAILGAFPAGSILTELVGTIIPNQRIDRIAKFAEELDAKLSKDMIHLQLSDENFTDLLEEGLKQAARAITDERRQYISSIIANSISSDKIEFIESKQLLKILGELNDIEIIWLRSFMVETFSMDNEFYNKHENILNPIITHLGLSSDAPEFDKSTLQQNYKDHLVQLRLLESKYKIDRKTGQIGVDRDGLLQISGYKITKLGRLLLKHIGLTKDGFTPLESNKES